MPALSPERCADLAFFAEFMAARDRVGWWLCHRCPPGDDAATVAARIDAFARSLLELPAGAAATVAGVTHSPVLRAADHVDSPSRGAYGTNRTFFQG